jgi:phosphate:Na+ symporter
MENGIANDWLNVLLLLTAGLVLFLYAVSSLSTTLQEVLGSKAKQWIAQSTRNIPLSILTGTIATFLLDSSSAVIIMAIVLVNSKAMNLRQSLGIVMGANIGTTLSSQIIALNVGQYAPLMLLVGFALVLVSKNPKLSQTGKVILYFGILFFGLFTMENAVEPLQNHPSVSNFLAQAENPWRGALAGCLITLVIQSSSATVGMSIVLVKKGILSLTASVAIMLGAELGTCSDTLLATIKGSRSALKTAVFHLVFNLFSIILGLILFHPFMELVLLLGEGMTPQRMLANAHVLFNVGGVLALAWTIPTAEKILHRIWPDSEPKE